MSRLSQERRACVLSEGLAFGDPSRVWALLTTLVAVSLFSDF